MSEITGRVNPIWWCHFLPACDYAALSRIELSITYCPVSHITFYNDSASTAQYFGATIVLLAISTSLTVLVLNVHYRGSLNNPVPPLVQLVVLNWLARLLRLGKRVHDKHKGRLNIAKMVWSLVPWSTKIKQWAINPNHYNDILGTFEYVISLYLLRFIHFFVIISSLRNG